MTPLTDGPLEAAAPAWLPPSWIARSERCHPHFGRTLKQHVESPAWGETEASSNGWRQSPAMSASHRGNRSFIPVPPSGDSKQHPSCNLTGTLSQTAQSSHSQIPDPQNVSDIVSVHGYLKPPSLGTIFVCAAIDKPATQPPFSSSLHAWMKHMMNTSNLNYSRC